MPDDQRARRLVAIGSAGALFGLSILIGVEVFWPSQAEETIEGQAAEIIGLAVVIAALSTIVTGWMKNK